jgi:hypothetical protein
MHGAVFQWFDYALSHRSSRENVKKTGNNVLEIGSLDINGSIKSLFNELTSDGGSYTGIDLQEGPGVDIVVDGVAFRSDTPFDIIVCAEVFEHTPVWPSIVANAYNHLVPGGFFIATMAGEGRPPHSAIDTNPIRSWEYYKNVTATELAQYLQMFADGEVNVQDTDTRCWAVKQS